MKGGLLLGVDNPRATEFLDWARLMMPGSLVEEAALRRLVLLLDFPSNQEKFLTLFRRYTKLYRKSPFAEKFKKFVVSNAIENSAKIDLSILDRFADVVALDSPVAALDFRLGIARKALLDGRNNIAEAQVEKASTLAAAIGQTRRLKIYSATIKAMHGNLHEGQAELEQLRLSDLNSDEQILMKVVDGVLTRLHDVQQAARPPEAAISDNETLPRTRTGVSAVVTSGIRSLEAAEAVLNRHQTP